MRRLFPLIIVGLALVIAPGLLPTAAAPAQEPTPTFPPPTWTPGPPPSKEPTPTSPLPTGTPGPPLPKEPTAVPRPQPAPVGGFIELRVPLTQAALGNTPWQELWTVVQWQDARGSWHDVEGWRGELDRVLSDANGGTAGQKVWWVDRADLGKGPFRWLVYRSEGGRLFARSASFYLPRRDGESVRVDGATN